MSSSSNDEEQTHLRLRIEGFVQAVGYRNYVIAEATRLGLDGWIRNRSDGTVEALVSGPNSAVEILVGFCMKGPPGSTVKNVELHKAEAPEEKGFKRRPLL
jgi:acylphosphatase